MARTGKVICLITGHPGGLLTSTWRKMLNIQKCTTRIIRLLKWRIDNTMTKRKKGKQWFLKHNEQQQIKHHEPYKNMGWTLLFRNSHKFPLHKRTHRLTLVTTQVRSNKCGKDWVVIMTNGTYLRSTVTVNHVMVETVKLSKWRLHRNH